MEFYDVLQKRHSVRDFSDKEVGNQKLKALIDAAVRAPSAGNLQAYKLYVVRSKTAREELVAATNYQGFIAKAPVIFVFCTDIRRAAAKYGERGETLYSIQDATLAAAYCQLAATAEGLSSVWVGGFDPLEVSRLINAGPHQVPVCVLPVGYANASPETTGRRPLKEIVREA